MEKKSSSDAFGTFLQSVQRYRQESAEGPARSIPQRLLRQLQESGPTPVVELMPQSELSFTELAEVLKEMEAADFITIQRVSGEEMVELTPVGEKVARFSESD
jgi:predicted transcriptional regulator